MKKAKQINELLKLDIITRLAASAERLIKTDPAGNAYNNILFLSPDYAAKTHPGRYLHTKPQGEDIIIRYPYRRLGETARDYHTRVITKALRRPSTVRTIGWVDGERRYWFGRSVWTHTDGQAIVDTDGGIWLLGGNAGAGLICHQHIIGGGLRADFYTIAGDRTMPKHAPAWLSHWDGKRVNGYMGGLYIKTATEVFKTNAINNIRRAVKKSGEKVSLSTIQTVFAHTMRGVIPVPAERWRVCGHVGTTACPTITPEQIDCVAAMLSVPTGISYMRGIDRNAKR